MNTQTFANEEIMAIIEIMGASFDEAVSLLCNDEPYLANKFNEEDAKTYYYENSKNFYQAIALKIL